MIIPFVNWGWKRKSNIDVSLGLNAIDRVREFTQLSREYDERLAHFETILNEEQYREFMDLRNCANRVVTAQTRLDFATEQSDRYIKRNVEKVT